MRTHNVSTLIGEIYDKLANNTYHEMFDINEYGLENIYVNENDGKIVIEYQDKKFELTAREEF